MLAPMTSSPVRARPAVAAAFAAQGLLFISLTTRLPTLQDTWDLGEVGLSLLLLMMVLLAGAGSLVAEVLAKRSHSAAVLRGGLLVVAVAVPLLVTAPTFAVFVAGLAAYGVGLGLVDAAGNMQAVAVEHAYARPILPSFHGAWTAGGVVAAGLTLVDPDLWLAAALARGARRGGAGRPVPAAGRRARHRRRGGAVAADRAGRPGDGALLHGRHRGDHVGTDVPRQHVPDAGPAGGAGDVPLPPRHAGDAAGRRRPGRPVRAGAGAPGRRGGRLGVAVRDRHRAQLAGGGRGLHPARPRRRGDRAAELLRGRPDRRRPGGPRGDPAGPGRRGDRPVQPVQLRRRPARRGAHRPRRRGLAARRVRRTDGAGAVHPAAGEELRSRGRSVPRS